MNNKIKFTLIVIVLMVLFAAVGIIVAGMKKTDGKEQPVMDKKSEEVREDIALVNKESYFYGYHLLDAPPEDFNASIDNSLPTPGMEEGGNRDSYYCSSYDGTYGITHISFCSAGANLFGIHVGDEAQVAAIVMENKGFERMGEDSLTQQYRKNDITVRFVVSSKEVIEEILISVVDPDAIQPDA